MKRLCIVLSMFIITTVAMTTSVSAIAGTTYISPGISYEGINSKSSISYIGYTPRLALGYGAIFSESIYLAAEIFVKVGSFTYSNNSGGVGSIKPQYSVGLSLLPSIILDSLLMAYLRLGGISTRFRHYDATQSGFQVGVGMEAEICKAWTVRVEYDYTGYSSISSIGTLREDEYILGLVYRFL